MFIVDKVQLLMLYDLHPLVVPRDIMLPADHLINKYAGVEFTKYFEVGVAASFCCIRNR